MKEAQPFKGAQVLPPLPPNNAQEECIRVRKVYDWVVFPSSECASVCVPRCCQKQVEEALRNGDVLSVGCCAPRSRKPFALSYGANRTEIPGQVNCRVVNIRRTRMINPETNIPVQVASLRLLFIIPVTITIRNDTRGCVLGTFEEFIRAKNDSVVVCLPEPLNESNIICHIASIQCGATGLFCEGQIEIDLEICKEVQVEADVKLEVIAKHCQPRPPITLPTPGLCPPLRIYPQQCGFFPVPNCQCQGEVVASVDNVTVSIGILSMVETGTASIKAVICPECNPNASSLQFNFIPNSIYTTNDVNFVATTISQPICTVTGEGNRTLTITGTGLLGTETVNFTLVLQEPGTPGLPSFYQLTLTNLAGTPIFSTSSVLVPSAQLTVRDCRQLPLS